jgi:hypothetical protein
MPTPVQACRDQHPYGEHVCTQYIHIYTSWDKFAVSHAALVVQAMLAASVARPTLLGIGKNPRFPLPGPLPTWVVDSLLVVDPAPAA